MTVQSPNKVAAMVAPVLPDGATIEAFVPVAHYDRFMDCIRVLIADRSVTEERIDDVLTLYRTNHPTLFDPAHCGFCLKGIRYIFDSLDIEKGAELRLTALIDAIVKKNPNSTVAKILGAFPGSELVVEWDDEREAA